MPSNLYEQTTLQSTCVSKSGGPPRTAMTAVLSYPYCNWALMRLAYSERSESPLRCTTTFHNSMDRKGTVVSPTYCIVRNESSVTLRCTTTQTLPMVTLPGAPAEPLLRPSVQARVGPNTSPLELVERAPPPCSGSCAQMEAANTLSRQAQPSRLHHSLVALGQ